MPAPPTATPSPTVVATPVSRWIPLPPLPLGGRQEVGVAHLDGRIYVIGGFAPGLTSRVEAYDIAADEWVEVAPLPVEGHHIGAAAAGGHVYAVGGLRGFTFAPTSDVFRYDSDEDRWEPVAPMPTAGGALAVAEVDGRIHAVAGIGLGGGAVTDHVAYIPEEDRWIELAPYPIAREHISGAAVDGVLYVVGGRSPLTTAAHRWDHESGQWHELPPMPTRRAGHGAAALSGRFVTFGGEGNPQNSRGIFPEVEVYDPATNRWTQLDNMRAPRHGIGAATVGDRIYVPGGADSQGFGAVATHDALEIDF
jgi:N-acetylneuraminic acid mutarotase